MTPVLLEMFVLPLDLLPGLGGEVFLDEGEVGPKADNKLTKGQRTSQRKFYSYWDHFLLYFFRVEPSVVSWLLSLVIWISVINS